MKEIIRREFRVALSPRAQPWWFRLIKWLFIVLGAAFFHDYHWFWPVLAGLIVLALIMHFFYRWKTHGWTRPWGGWDDVNAARDPGPS